MAVAIRIKRGTKANIESAKATLKQWEQVYATDTDEIGIYDGSNIRWQSSGGGGGGEGVDLSQLPYMNHAASIYYKSFKSDLFKPAWEHSLEVDAGEINSPSVWGNPRGKAQYPNDEVEGVIIPNSVTSIGNNTFVGLTSNNQPLVIPNSVTSIGQNAFRSWTSNNQPLVIPNSVTSIDPQAFSDWTSNNQPLVIPNSVTSIKANVFSDWTSNNQPLVIPDSVTSIGYRAFDNWQLVPYIIIHATTPPSLSSSNAFSGQNDTPIYVPHNSVSAYKNATNWSALSARIFSIEEL